MHIDKHAPQLIPFLVALHLGTACVLLWFGDRLQRSRAHRPPEKLTFGQAFFVGLAQVGALIPGFSRSGLTMIAGNAAGLTAEKAAEFSFLLGTPIIFAAGLLEVPKLFHAPDQLADALLGGV